MSKIEKAQALILDAIYLSTLAEIVSQELELTPRCPSTQSSKYAGAVWIAARIAGEKLSEVNKLLEAEMEDRRSRTTSL